MPGARGRTAIRARRGRRRAASLASALLLSTCLAPGQRAAAAGPSFWERAAEPPQARCDRFVGEAESVGAAGPDGGPAAARLTRAEALARQALALCPDHFRGLMILAELASRAERPAATAAALGRACPRAPRGAVAGACWFRLGVERSRLGQLEEALRAYEAAITLGDADAAAHANAGELLMTLGRLEEAIARYREAIRLDAPPSPSVRLENAHGLTLSTYGLAVALDRAGRAGPAREAMARALVLDPRLAKLRAAERPGGDVFFLPEGDVFYYLGLASEIAGHVDDAEAAFQEFLARQPKGRWAAQARAHVVALEARARAGAVGRVASALRVVAAGTVLASGPVPAPLVDAAWRGHAHLLDDCLDEAVARGALPPRDSFRLALELEIDARGAVSAATVRAPATLDATLARCVEAAVRAGLRVPRPSQPRPTRARLELLVAVAAGEPGGV